MSVGRPSNQTDQLSRPSIVSTGKSKDMSSTERKGGSRDIGSKGGSSQKATFDEANADRKEVLVAIMGATGCGKTTFINKVSGSELRVGRGLQSCTSAVQISKSFELDGHLVTLIDTPGFDDTTKSDTDILTMIAAFLASAYQQGIRLAGVIYMHRISDFRMGGLSTRNFKMFRALCGKRSLRNVVLVSNMWGEVALEIGEAREKELAEEDMFFKPVLAKGTKFLRHDNTMEGAQAILRYIIGKHPIALRIQRELVDEHKDISETSAGAELDRELHEQAKKHQAELKQLQVEMSEALRLKDEEAKEEIEKETQKLQADIARIQGDSDRMVSAYNEEKARLAAPMREMELRMQEENNRLAADYERQTQVLSERLREQQDMDSRERAELMSTIQRLERLQEQNAQLARQRPKIVTAIGWSILRVLCQMVGRSDNP